MFMKDFSNDAYNYLNKNFTSEEIISALKNGDDVNKSAAILSINFCDELISNLLIYNLTNQSGPVRELCAYKISELIPVYHQYFQRKTTLNIIINSLTDVNPNVVRFMLVTLNFIDNKDYIFENICNKIQNLYNEISKIPRRGKTQEHVYTKKCFKIYWLFESIKTILTNEPKIKVNSKFKELIQNLSCCDQYTIREKIAQIVNLLPKTEFSGIKKKLEKDNNYFVKRGCK